MDEWGVNVQGNLPAYPSLSASSDVFQALTGSLANIYTYNALLQPRESILRMELSHGGHISHGHQIGGRSVSDTAHRFRSIPYHVDLSTGLIDYNEVASLAAEYRPRIIVAGGSSYCRHVDLKELRRIAYEVGALLHYDMSHFCGLVASGVFPSPFEFCDVVTTTTYKTLRGPQGALILFRKWMEDAINSTVFPRYQCGSSYRTIAAIAVALNQARTEDSKKEQGLFLKGAAVLSEELMKRGYSLLTGGTDCHMMLINLRDKSVAGYEAQCVLEEVNILANQNPIPGDTGIHFTGLRLATTPMVARGMTAGDFIHTAELVHRSIELARKLGKEFAEFEQGPGRSKKRFRQFVQTRGQTPELLALKADVAEFAAAFPWPGYLYECLD